MGLSAEMRTPGSRGKVRDRSTIDIRTASFSRGSRPNWLRRDGHALGTTALAPPVTAVDGNSARRRYHS